MKNSKEIETKQIFQDLVDKYCFEIHEWIPTKERFYIKNMVSLLTPIEASAIIYNEHKVFTSPLGDTICWSYGEWIINGKSGY